MNDISNELLNKVLTAPYARPVQTSSKDNQPIGHAQAIKVVDGQMVISTTTGKDFLIDLPVPKVFTHHPKPNQSKLNDEILLSTGNSLQNPSQGNVTAFMLILILAEIAEVEGRSSFVQAKNALMDSLSKGKAGIDKQKVAALTEIITGVLAAAATAGSGILTIRGAAQNFKEGSTAVQTGTEEVDLGVDSASDEFKPAQSSLDATNEDQMERQDIVETNDTPSKKTLAAKELKADTGFERHKGYAALAQAIGQLAQSVGSGVATEIKAKGQQEQLVADALKSLMQNRQMTLKSFVDLLQNVSQLMLQMGEANAATISSAGQVAAS